jgi:hypothetical protein
MAKKKHVESTLSTEQQATGQLIAVLESLTEEIETLTKQAGMLSNHIHVLTEAIDDVRAELAWATRNLNRPAWTPVPAVGMPLDLDTPVESEHTKRPTSAERPPETDRAEKSGKVDLFDY